jgi:hypothetical protein
LKNDIPAWAPPHLVDFDMGIPCIKRLLTYPEMEVVWNTFYSWWGEWAKEYEKKRLMFIPNEESDLNSYFQYYFSSQHSQKLKGIALKCNADSLGVIAMTEPTRQKLCDSISNHAKQLKNDLIKFQATPILNAHFDPQIQHKYLLDFLERFADDFGYDDLSEALCNIGEESNPDHESLSAKIDFFIWGEIKFQLRRGSMGNLRRSDATIYNVLDYLADARTDHLSKPIVERGLDQNKRRLLGIRSLARFIYNHLGQNPSPIEARQIIATFIRVALDDPEVGEDTVKDALKNFDLTRE